MVSGDESAPVGFPQLRLVVVRLVQSGSAVLARRSLYGRGDVVGSKAKGGKKFTSRGSSPLEGGKGRVGVVRWLPPQPFDLVVGGSELPVPIRGRWMRDHYGHLRNAAWFVRNYRMVGHDDTVFMAHVCYAVRQLLEAGEPLEAVVPSLVDLFVRP